ncbi:BamA/OMP85 family outer membrane protein [Stygiobacter electus]|uniref:BamA/TamA family outer membrane protein n=1 Tax=Stygiobacter electus TaxID=3032292 RepID=A0AAE3TCW1_9BACT|nr:BamA/TamA family outer membrane protein [Stygiobacter electus]MDF1612345.1 BamA/TamA family outer membrane protein [Stygiobacter electus]
MRLILVKTIVLFFVINSVSISQEKKFELTKINFVGNNSISTSNLLSIIYSKESPNWVSQLLNKFSSIGGKPIYFDSLLIASDIQAIKSYYQSKGYFKTKVKANYVINTKKNEAELNFIIDEREPAFIKSFMVKGFEWIAAEYREYLLDYIQRDTNRVYEDAIIEQKNNYTLTYLRDRGYMLIKAEKPLITIDTIKNKVEILLSYNAGKRYKISNIFTTRTGKGFDKIDDELLYELVSIKPGSWYSHADIQRGQVRLYRTNLFTSSIINSIISDTVGNTVPLNINVDIGLMHELSPEIIMNNEDNTFNLGTALNFVRKNFLGGARKLTASTSIAAQNISEFIKKPSFADSSFYGYADARISLEQPFIFGYPISTKLESYFTLQKRRNEYNSTLYGGKVSFDFELPYNVYLNSLNMYFNVEHSEYLYKREYLVNIAANYFELKEGLSLKTADSLANYFVDNQLKSRSFNSTNQLLGLNFGANKTDDFLYPTNGYSLSFVLEEANSIAYLFSKIFNTNFERPLSFKTIITSTFYPQIYNSKTNVFGIKFKVGKIFTYRGNQADISINQRLYAGGSNSIRGWGTRQLVPKNPLLNLTNITQEDLDAFLIKGAVTGGFILMEGSFESRHKFLDKLGAVLFIDYGNTWNDYNEVRIDQIAVAAGFGFRFYSDFIPFRIDFGFKAYDPQDQRSFFKKKIWGELLQFHIGIGEAF